MHIRVLAFATASDILGKEVLELTLPEGSRLEQLRNALVARHPHLETLWTRFAIAIDGELVRGDAALADGCEVAILPPVSGGRARGVLTDDPIDIAAVERSVTDPSCGAVLLFLGNVRDHHAGRQVTRLDYSAYRTMAEAALERIASELEAEGDLKVAITHRLGQVPVGEASVVIAVSSPHRQAAYEASRVALERLKREVPIWKHEHYADGVSMWREEESLVADQTAS